MNNIINECEICFEVKPVYGCCMHWECKRGICKDCFRGLNRKKKCPFCRRPNVFYKIKNRRVLRNVRDAVEDINTLRFEQRGLIN